MRHSGCLFCEGSCSLAAMLARASLLSAVLVALAGCAPEFIEGNYNCTNPDKDYVGPDGIPDPCHDQGPVVDAGLECPVGKYIHWRAPWLDPMLLWSGPADQVPECPLGSVSIAYEGRTDLVAPPTCEACTCQSPTGSCALPSTLAVQADVCGPQGTPPLYWNAPASWDGLCDGTTQVPTGKAYSVKIDPLTMTENGCAPGPTLPAKVVSLYWNTFARGCDVVIPKGPTPRSLCLPDGPVQPGFKLCIFLAGENACPDDTPDSVFTEQHIFYQGVEDNRQCSACDCGSPTGSACTATISIYKGNDLTCNGSTVTQTTISSVGPVCLDIALPGQSLGSKSIDSKVYLPSTCAPIGGDESGSAIKTQPATLCCRP
jgi:hypothetical protein